MSPTVDLNWDGISEEGFKLPPEGTYLAEVDTVEVKISQGGDKYLNVQLRDAETRENLCYDILMLTGKGAGIGMAKLIQLGIEKGTPRLEPMALTGRRAHVKIYHDTYEGKTRAKVALSNEEGFKCGYRAEASVAETAPHGIKIETPF